MRSCIDTEHKRPKKHICSRLHNTEYIRSTNAPGKFLEIYVNDETSCFILVHAQTTLKDMNTSQKLGWNNFISG